MEDIENIQLSPTQIPSTTRNGSKSPIRQQSPSSSTSIITRKALVPLTQPSNRKHHLSGLPEPVDRYKRQTLAERAGDTSSTKLPAPSSVRPVNPAVTVTVAAGPTRNNAFTASLYSVGAPALSRGRSNTTFSTSVSSGIQPPTTRSSVRSRPVPVYGRIPRQAAIGGSASNTMTKGGIYNASTIFATSANIATEPIGSANGTKIGNRCTSAGPQGAPTAKGMPILPIAPEMSAPDQFRPFNASSPVPSYKGGSRDVSISSAMHSLTLDTHASATLLAREGSPCKLPRPTTPAPMLLHPPTSTSKSRLKSIKRLQFLTKDSYTTAWDTAEEYAKIERTITETYSKFTVNAEQSASMKEAISTYKAKILESQQNQALLIETNHTLRCELDETRSRLNQELDATKCRLDRVLDQVTIQGSLHAQQIAESDKLRSELIEKNFTLRSELESTKSRLDRELEQISSQGAVHQQQEQMLEHTTSELAGAKNLNDALQSQMVMMTSKASDLQGQVIALQTRLEDVSTTMELLRHDNEGLRTQLTTVSSGAASNASTIQALQAKIDYLESDSKSQSEHYAAMQQQMAAAIQEAQESKEKLRKEESIRRKLHNQIQELKGNIRVFCRVRPATTIDGTPTKQARITLPDVEESNQIEVRGPEESSSLGKDTTKTHPFAFDRVFGSKSSNTEIFEEISQLIQSALDGYNVCVFAYGQTGSGKTHTMSSEDGMIPKALRMIYNKTKELEECGWRYTMTGSFVEVYNENLNDLLGKADDMDQKKLELKHDMQKCQTNITNVTIVDLDSAETVESILAKAMTNRSVAATQANERSSRSHSVFMLTLVGENTITGEKSRGTLNLVDLAGSERLNQSKAEGARLKETQSINRSLSCLGDVIGALGQGKEGGHVPYRNSKLTNLLQFSLGGNSKTLMFCMVSPSRAHLNESLTTLRFAAKVHSTHIGRARKV